MGSARPCGDYIRLDEELPTRGSARGRHAAVCVFLSIATGVAPYGTRIAYRTVDGLRLAMSRPKCKYDVWCRLYEEEEHSNLFAHPCRYITNGTAMFAPGTAMRLDKEHPCTNFDDTHRKRYTHQNLTVDEPLEVDETPDDLDAMVLSPPDEIVESGEAIVVSEEEALEAKAAASEAMSEGDFEKALGLYTKAVPVIPSALVLANRANCFLKLKKPRAAAADCKMAIGINPDSAKAYKIYGKALCMLGEWDEAYKQLCSGNRLDSDPDSADLQKQVQQKLAKIKKNVEIRAKLAAKAAEAEAAAKTASEQNQTESFMT